MGITDIFADGSFCTEKDRPGDIDGYYVCDFNRFYGEQLSRLLAIDGIWDLRQAKPDTNGKLKPLMWHKYRVELFPMFEPPFSSLSRAASEPLGRPILFNDFFRRTRTGGHAALSVCFRSHPHDSQ